MLKIMLFVRQHIIELVACGLVTVFVLWAIGYVANGLFNAKFQLESCWAGMAAIGSTGLIALLKYLTDSWLNTDKGVKPE